MTVISFLPRYADRPIAVDFSELPVPWAHDGAYTIYLDFDSNYRYWDVGEDGFRNNVIQSMHYPNAIKGLSEWAKKWEVPLVIDSHTSWVSQYRNSSRPFQINLVKSYEISVDDVIQKFEDFPCGKCGTVNHYGSFECSNEDCRQPFLCASCRTFNNPLVSVFGRNSFCLGCAQHQCPECSTFYAGECFTCNEVRECSHCLQTFESNYSGMEVCPTCINTYCVHCGTFGHTRLTTDDNGASICPSCVQKSISEEFIPISMPATKLTLPSIEGRENIRMCGVEIEGGDVPRVNSGEYLAMSLYEAGLSTAYTKKGYHSGNHGFAKVERDGSCEWEVILGPINMANNEHVRKLNAAVKIIKGAIRGKKAKLDIRCGVHIHVSAERVKLSGAYNLHILYTYLEDVFYRLGSAHWPYHRAIVNGDSMCLPIPKMTDTVAFAQNFHGADRHYGLSFNNYFERIFDNCGCGAAQYGEFEKCKCALGKCTFEFRVFNTTSNIKKLHAYLALTQAIVAKALSMDEIDNPMDYKAMPFKAVKYNDVTPGEKRNLMTNWKSRLAWMGENLPMTLDERNSLLYCALNCELAKIGEDTLKKLLKIEEVTT